MPFDTKDTEVYRRNEKAGGKLLTPEERLRLLEPYLPPTKQDLDREERAQSRRITFGVRNFLKTQLHVLTFTIIHAIFSIYIHTRQAYHAVRDRTYSIFFYHHRDPAMIQNDVKRLSKVPKVLSVILKVEDGKGGTELERLVNEVAEVSAWCASAGIPALNVYEKTGLLKQYLPETHRAISQNLRSYFGKQHPTLTVCAPHAQSIESPSSPQTADFGGASSHLTMRLICAEDGRDSMVDLTKTLAEMAQKHKISPADIEQRLLDVELRESVMEESDLLIVFGPHIEFQGYPPWHLHLTEIYHVPDNESVGYQVFYSGLCKYANAQFRLGR